MLAMQMGGNGGWEVGKKGKQKRQSEQRPGAQTHGDF